MIRTQRREFKEKLKRYNELAPSINEFIQKEHLVEGDNAVIYIKINDDTQLYNPFSYGDQLVINQDIVDYIDSKAHNIPVRYPLRICFVGDLQVEDKKKIQNLLYEYYFLALQNKKIDLHRNFIKIIALFIIGTTFLLLWFALEAYELGQLFSEIVSIIGTFALWEVADFYILERTEIKMEYVYAGQIATASIDFFSANEAT